MTGPAASDGWGASRILEEFFYDDGNTFTGLWAEKYSNQSLNGVPEDQGLWTDLGQTWTGNQTPPGISGDKWSARLSGMLVVPQVGGQNVSKKYEFKVTADDGVTLAINGRVLVDCFGQTGSQVNCGQPKPPTMILKSGERPITIEFQDKGGDAELKIKWGDPGGDLTFIPAGVLVPNLGLLTSQRVGPNVAADTLRVETTYGFAGDQPKMQRLPAFQRVKDLGTGFVRRTNYTYDDYGRRTALTRYAGTPSAATSERIYTDSAAEGTCMTKTIDPTGAEVEYECSDLGDVTLVRQKLREVTVGAGTVLQPQENRTETRAYDKVGRLVTLDEPGPGLTTYTFDRSGRLLTQNVLVDSQPTPRYATTEFVYTYYGLAAGYGAQVIERLPDPDQSIANDRPVVTRLYDWVGNELQSDDPRNGGWIWSAVYDGQNRATSVTSPDPAGSNPALATTTVYTLKPLAVGVTDSAGVATTTTMDLLGRTSSEQAGTLASTVYTYDDAGNLLKESVGTDQTWTGYSYNALGQKTKVTNPWWNGSSVESVDKVLTYHPDTGKLMHLDGPLSGSGKKDEIGLTRDAVGRLTVVTMHTTSTTAYDTKIIYNDADERIRIASDLDPAGTSNGLVQRRDFEFTKSGLLAKATERHGATTAVYTAAGAPAPDPVTTYGYNPAGWVTSVTDPVHTTQFAYDDLGREKRRWRGTNTHEITTTYLRDGSINTIKGTDLITWTYAYDELGRTTSVSSPSYSTNYVYNALGQVQSEAANGQTTSYTYYTTNAAGGKYKGLLEKQTDAVTGGNTVYTYDSLGRVSTRLDPATMTWTRTYEQGTGRLDTQTITKPVSNTPRLLAYFDLDYDKAGNVTSRMQKIWHMGAQAAGTDPLTAPSPAGTGTTTYTYDGQGRMLTASGPAKVGTTWQTGTFTYTYDGLGNRRSEQAPGASNVKTTTDAQGWPISTDNGTPSNASDDTSYRFDERGQLWKVLAPTSQLSVTFGYDTWGRTTSATTSGSSSATVTYAIDAFGRTTSRTVGSAVTTYRYAGSSETLVTATAGTTVTKYASTPGGPLAQKVGTAAAQVYIRDLHGDVVGRLATSATDMAAATWFSPWGKPVELESTPAVLGYQSQLTDPSTGTVDMLTRQYVPDLGRFATRDVLFGGVRNPMSLNQYGYAEGNPITFDDPTGMGMGCQPGQRCHPDTKAPANQRESEQSGHDEDTGQGQGPRGSGRQSTKTRTDEWYYNRGYTYDYLRDSWAPSCPAWLYRTPCSDAAPSMDDIQLALAICGSVFVVGDLVCEPIDLAISLGRGDWVGAGLDFAGFFPLAGAGADVADVARSGVRASRLGDDALRVGDDAFTHGYRYDPRVRARGLQDPVGHNFPYSYDDVILGSTPVRQSDGSLLYRTTGSLNGKDGFFEIAVNPNTGTIFHRTFTGI